MSRFYFCFWGFSFRLGWTFGLVRCLVVYTASNSYRKIVGGWYVDLRFRGWEGFLLGSYESKGDGGFWCEDGIARLKFN